MADLAHLTTRPVRFDEPWHADVFALALALSDAGHFPWTTWSERFGANLAAAAAKGGPTDGSNYYDVWLDTLEGLLTERGLAAPDTLAKIKEAWTTAYLETPHGAPVELDR